MKKIFLLLLSLSLFACVKNDDFESNQQALEQQRKQYNDQLKIDNDLIETYVTDNNLTVKKTAQGLQYIIEEEGSGKSPEANDGVEMKYKGLFLDGTEFANETEKIAEFSPIRNLIFGFAQGLTLLKEGGKAKLIIPSGLAYGTRGNTNEKTPIPPNTILIFEVELLKVK